MEVMGEYKGEVSNEFIEALEKESTNLGIDPDELDIRPDNFMVHPKSGKLKMTDVQLVITFIFLILYVIIVMYGLYFFIRVNREYTR